MKSIKGILFIILIMSSSASLWYFATPIEPIHVVNRLSHIIGGMAITGFFLVFFLATRIKIFERWFHGLENVYFYHKYLAIFSLVLVIIHGQLQDLVPRFDKVERTSFSEFAKELGSLGQYGFIALILIALLAKFLKYEHWRIFHRLLLIPYTFGIYHAYFSSKYDLLQPTPLGIFTVITATIGFMSALYMLTMYQDMFFKYNGNITGIKKLGPNVIELELTLNKTLPYRHGQFIFIKILQDGIEKAPHPFSISGGDGKKVFISMKVLGDFTKKVYDSVQLNTPVTLDGPYGHFDFENAAQQQIWIAGGIGITPFLSYLQSQPVDRNIELFYTYHGVDNAIYKKFLQEYAQTNQQFSVNFIDTAQMDRLSFENISVPAHTSIFMCGPQKMLNHFAKQLKTCNKDLSIHFEAFKFK
ncbi:hypothetical protein ABE61_03310 [Lysinibacillus sphaericus]|uniref:ferredoxin reductase family protein n=1 Tax=Lysinibacillus sphaericus TaxID=1421 RepID=UPI0018CC85AF|nr:ferric reductase-like transmembrane domain-containing protein [Lysinibacillus sphaericus]MBG9453115.1 hypothetical protein [Lysinibacillus sphaericus]MBG9477592.1 hypothetical protein [Lysinibacillus sphaericus]MBG9594381.1 hypothetical protein [Lysinibacillus sphaericus]